MFGYVKPFKPQMRVYEWDLYNGLYCGLCKKLRKEYGYVSAAMLSYDIVFFELTAIGLSKNSAEQIKPEKQVCPLHPFRKRLCMQCRGEAQDRAVAVQVILSFHKLLDDIYDGTIPERLRAAAILPFMVMPYTKASERYKTTAQAVSGAMKLQRSTERDRIRSIDRAAEPTAAMTAAVFRELGGNDPDLRSSLSEMGYMLGRYIYLCDALDDLEDDKRKGKYNPLAYHKHARELAENTVYLTLGRLSGIYSRLELGEIRSVTDNIVYLGLKYTFDRLDGHRGKRRPVRRGIDR